MLEDRSCWIWKRFRRGLSFVGVKLIRLCGGGTRTDSQLNIAIVDCLTWFLKVLI